MLPILFLTRPVSSCDWAAAGAVSSQEVLERERVDCQVEYR
jgi:hypothetical protein